MKLPNYSLLFSLRVIHPYFNQGLCDCLLFKPDSSTQTILQRFGLKVHQAKNGIDLYAQVQTTIPEFLAYLEKISTQAFFKFEINTQDQYFSVFTQSPLDEIGGLIYDSTSSLNVTKEGITQLTAAYQEQASTLLPGTLKIYFKNLSKIISTDEKVSYEIIFEARTTQWEYYIINHTNIPTQGLSIGGKSTIEFSGPESVSLPNNKAALLFSSKNELIPLSQTPIHQFDLMQDVESHIPSASEKKLKQVLFKGLPNPSLENIRIKEVNGQKIMSSPMYIYI